MLKEFPKLRQTGDGYRRLFVDNDEGLYLWLWYRSKRGQLVGFQLSYVNWAGEWKALTWDHSAGYRHNSIDEGDTIKGRKKAPVLTADRAFPSRNVAQRFYAQSAGLEPALSRFIYERLLHEPDGEHSQDADQS
jgi:hypothetical protein